MLGGPIPSSDPTAGALEAHAIRERRTAGKDRRPIGVFRATVDTRDRTMVQSRFPGPAAAAAAGALALALGGAAAAHSRAEATAPANGAVVATAPEAITIAFDKPMRITLIELTNAVGDAFALERTDEMAPVTRFEATPPALPAGSYTVRWRGLSEDGHAMKGTFSFEVRP